MLSLAVLFWCTKSAEDVATKQQPLNGRNVSPLKGTKDVSLLETAISDALIWVEPAGNTTRFSLTEHWQWIWALTHASLATFSFLQRTYTRGNYWPYNKTTMHYSICQTHTCEQAIKCWIFCCLTCNRSILQQHWNFLWITACDSLQDVREKYSTVCSVWVWMEMLMQQWRPESKLDRINSGS